MLQLVFLFFKLAWASVTILGSKLISCGKKKVWNNTLYDNGGPRPSDKGGRGGRGHPDPEIRGGQSQKKYFSALRASVWSTNKEVGPDPPGPSPESASVLRGREHNGWNNYARILNLFWLLKCLLYVLDYYRVKNPDLPMSKIFIHIIVTLIQVLQRQTTGIFFS